MIILLCILNSLKSSLPANEEFCINQNQIDCFKRIKKNTYSKKIVDSYKPYDSVPCIKCKSFHCKISWQEYLLIDNINFADDVLEMYDKYKCKYEFSNIKNFADLYDVFINKEINPILYIHNINQLYLEEIKHNKKSNNKNTIIKKAKQNNLEICLSSEFKIQSTEFQLLLNIIIDDFICVYNNAKKYSYICTDNIDTAIAQLKTSKYSTSRLVNFINISNKILNMKIRHFVKINTFINKIYIDNLLLLEKTSNEPLKTIMVHISSKFCSLQRNYKKKQFKKKDLLQCTFNYLKNINDIKIKQISILGLQTFFSDNHKDKISRFSKVLIFLYAYTYNKEYFKIDWCEQLFRLLSVSKKSLKSNKKFVTIYKRIRSDDDFLKYNFYFALNSYFIEEFLDFYDEIKKYKSEFELLNYSVDLLSKVKCRLFSLDFEI